LLQELKGINPAITNALHIRGSVIINWLKFHNKRQVQYMAGHKYISSTEAYAVQDLDSLQDELSKHHPFG
jgi:integrase/recombinase XerD